MRHRFTPRRAAAALAMGAAVAGLVGLARAPGEAAAQPLPLPGECPPVMPVAEVSRGMTGTALSVVQGTEPSAFDVEVLGVLKDGIAPGLDLIVVNLSGPVIDATRGLWFGASGSPVYLSDPVNGRQELVGALAYGLAGGGSTLAGITPAASMVGLLTLPEAAQRRPAARIRVPDALARRMAARAGISVAQAGSLERLRIPLSISGLTPRGMRYLRRTVARQDLPLVPYAGSSAGLPGAAQVAEIAAGDSFVAAESLGDITSGAVGTTTFVCSGKAVAFGHPFTWTGQTTLAARSADTIGIVADPIFGSYKLVNIGENAGVVTQDRLAGIAGRLGAGPATAPVATRVTDLDTGRSRIGTSFSAMPEFTPFLSFLHTFTNIDVTIDRIGRGNSEILFRIEGTRPDGSPWRFKRSNHYADPFDISFGSVFELADAASLLTSFDGVQISGIQVTRLDVERRYEHYDLRRVLVWNGREFVRQPFVAARPGKPVRLRAVLRPAHGSELVHVPLTLRVPKWIKRGGIIEVRGGQASFSEVVCLPGADCAEFSEGEGEGDGEAEELTFDSVLAGLKSQPRNDLLTARLRTGPALALRSGKRKQLDAVVSGVRILEFFPIR